MSTRWKILGRTPAKRAKAHFVAQVRKLAFWQRWDIVLIAIVVSSPIILSLLYTLAVKRADRIGWFDAPLLQPIADERILVNVRDNIASRPIRDAVMHKPNGQVYIIQEGGTIHRYTPATGLWSSETPFSSPAGLANPEMDMLRSGCGSDPLSYRVQECPDPESLWAVSADAGLVRHRDGDWEIVISDTALVAADGTPVEDSELTAAAVSSDNRWLVVGTKEDGIGIYDIEHRQWMPGKATLDALLPQRITHVIWFEGRFWVGGPEGLSALEVDTNPPTVYSIPEIEGHILDLDADADGALWIMEQRDCEESGERCLWLGKLKTPTGNPVTVIDERNVFSNLDMEDLILAQQWGDQLILAGDTGIFSYDTEYHTWTRRFEGRVLTTLRLIDRDGFYFGYTGGAGIAEKDRVETWPIPAEQVVKLSHGDRNDLLALTATGNVFSIDSAGNVEPIFQPGSTQFIPERFTAAVSLGDTLLLKGLEGALLHNISTRHYQDIPAIALPEWLLSPDVELFSSGDYLYALSPSGRDKVVYTFPKSKVTRVDFYDSTPSELIPGPVRHVRAWGDEGIGLIAGDGQVHRFTPYGQENLTGAAVRDMNQDTFLDVAALDQGLVVLTERGLRYYDGDSRAWTDFFDTPDGDSPVEVDTVGQRIFARTELGRLVILHHEDWAQVIIGDETGFRITDGGLTDAQSIGQQLYLAGDGLIEQYDLDQRRITNQWNLFTTGPVRLKGALRGVPLALSEYIVTLGGTSIDTPGGPVTGLFTSNDTIWTVRNDDGHKYMKNYHVNAKFEIEETRCLFRNPRMDAAVTRNIDARTLPGGTVAVATDAGLRFYDPKARSWFYGPVDSLPNGGRVYVFGQYLVLAETYRPDGFQVSFIPNRSIEIPDSCATHAASLQGETITVTAITIDERSGRAAWLQHDGTVVEWRLDQEEPQVLLPPSVPGPSPADLRRLYQRPGYLLFTTDSHIVWRYDLLTHQWSTITLVFTQLASSITDINIEEQDGHEVVIVHLETGEIYRGSFEGLTPTTGVRLRRIYTPPDTSFGATAEALLDVQDGKVWTFVLDDRIKYYAPERREWLPDVEFDDRDRSRSYRQAIERGIVTSDEGQTWWVAQSLGDTPSRFARYEREEDEITAMNSAGTIWRLTRDGMLWQCAMPDEGDYSCSQYSSPPFLFDRWGVRRAFRWQDLVLLETDQGLRAFSPASGSEVALPPAAAGFTDVIVARDIRGQIWLYSDDGLLILSKNRDAGIETTLRTDRDMFIQVYTIYRTILITLLIIFGVCSLIGLAKTKKSGKLSTLLIVGCLLLALTVAGSLAARSFWIHDGNMVTNDWSSLRKNAARLPNREWAYDPIMTLSADEQGNLFAVRPSRSVLLDVHGTVELETPPPLDTGWLQWNRARERFTVASPSGSVTIPKDEFIVDGHLIFEPVDAVLATGTHTLHAANQHGVWTFNEPNLSLDGSNITYQSIQLPPPIAAAHGRFLVNDGDLLIGENRLRQIDRQLQILFGDVTLTEQVWEREIDASIASGQAKIPAFSDQGFIWDANRRGLAYGEEGLLVQTDAGIHSVGAFEHFDPGPDGSARQGATLHSEGGFAVFLHHDGTWSKRESTGWVTGVKDPVANRILINDSKWRWELQDGELDIQLSTQPHEFAFLRDERGYSFSSDRLLAAAAHEGRLYVMTEAFLEIADEWGDIGTLTASRMPPRPTDQIEEIHFADGSTALFHRHEAAVSRWDVTTMQFAPVSGPDNPYQQRLLVETDHLRMTGYPTHVAKELGVQDISGNSHWIDFDFIDGRFPFDVVTSIASQGNELYVGTAAGLQIYSVDLETGLDNIDQIHHLDSGSGTSPSLVAVSQVGVPEEAPDIVMARSPAGCIERQPGGNLAPCLDPSLLDRELRAETDLWRWTTNSAGSIIGQYKNNHGNLVPGEVSITEGRFPHDHIEDVVVCNGRAFSLWNSQRITAYSDNTIRLGPGLQTYTLAHAGPNQFICIERKVPLTSASISPGLYFEGRGGQVWQFSATLWTKVTDPEVVSGLREYADRPPIVNRERLRLLPPQGNEGYRFEWRTLDGRWQPLPWRSGRVAVDQWHDFLFLHNRLWAATPAGLVVFSRDANGQVVLDADAVIVVREPADRQGMCAITDLSAENGMALARCDADETKVYQGQLDGQQDVGVFHPFNGPDPFTEQELISETDTGYWQWRLTGRAGGQRGSLVATLHQEDVHLAGGRFDFDTMHAIAFSEDNRVEISTETGGWFQAPRTSLHVRNLTRPYISGVDPTAISEVWITHAGEEQRLCLLEDGGYVRLASNGLAEHTERCPEYLGDDGFWHYAKDDERLSIITPNSIGGTAVRHLETGRFTDDVVIGLPVTGQDADGIFYLLPTQAGVLRLDRDLGVERIHTPSFADLPEGIAPRVLFMHDVENAIYAGQQAFHYLDAVRQPVDGFGPTVPQGAELRAVEDGPQNFVRLRWTTQGERGWHLARRHDLAPLLFNSLLVDLLQLDEFSEHRAEWGYPEPWMGLGFVPDGVEVRRLDSARSFLITLPEGFDLLVPIVAQERLLLIGEHELLDVNLEHAMYEAFSLPLSPPAPTLTPQPPAQARRTGP